jgi:two-component system chemotaxis response regulator CheY
MKSMRAGAHQLLIEPFAPSMLYRRMQMLMDDKRKFVLYGGRYMIEGTERLFGSSSKAGSRIKIPKVQHVMPALQSAKTEVVEL